MGRVRTHLRQELGDQEPRARADNASVSLQLDAPRVEREGVRVRPLDEAVVDPRAATAGCARAPTAKETDILARCVGSSLEAVDSASRVGDDVDLFRAMNRREISVLTVYEKQSVFFAK